MPITIKSKKGDDNSSLSVIELSPIPIKAENSELRNRWLGYFAKFYKDKIYEIGSINDLEVESKVSKIEVFSNPKTIKRTRKLVITYDLNDKKIEIHPDYKQLKIPEFKNTAESDIDDSHSTSNNSDSSSEKSENNSSDYAEHLINSIALIGLIKQLRLQIKTSALNDLKNKNYNFAIQEREYSEDEKQDMFQGYESQSAKLIKTFPKKYNITYQRENPDGKLEDRVTLDLDQIEEKKVLEANDIEALSALEVELEKPAAKTVIQRAYRDYKVFKEYKVQKFYKYAEVVAQFPEIKISDTETVKVEPVKNSNSLKITTTSQQESGQKVEEYIIDGKDGLSTLEPLEGEEKSKSIKSANDYLTRAYRNAKNYQFYRDALMIADLSEIKISTTETVKVEPAEAKNYDSLKITITSSTVGLKSYILDKDKLSADLDDVTQKITDPTIIAGVKDYLRRTKVALEEKNAPLLKKVTESDKQTISETQRGLIFGKDGKGAYSFSEKNKSNIRKVFWNGHYFNSEDKEVNKSPNRRGSMDINSPITLNTARNFGLPDTVGEEREIRLAAITEFFAVGITEVKVDGKDIKLAKQINSEINTSLRITRPTSEGRKTTNLEHPEISLCELKQIEEAQEAKKIKEDLTNLFSQIFASEAPDGSEYLAFTKVGNDSFTVNPQSRKSFKFDKGILREEDDTAFSNKESLEEIDLLRNFISEDREILFNNAVSSYNQINGNGPIQIEIEYINKATKTVEIKLNESSNKYQITEPAGKTVNTLYDLQLVNEKLQQKLAAELIEEERLRKLVRETETTKKNQPRNPEEDAKTKSRIEDLRTARIEKFENVENNEDKISVALFRSLKKLFEGGKENALESNPIVTAESDFEKFRTKILNQGDRSTLVAHAIDILEKDITKNSGQITQLKQYTKPNSLDRETEKSLSTLAIKTLIDYYNHHEANKIKMTGKMQKYFSNHMDVGKKLYDVAFKGEIPSTTISTEGLTAKKAMEEIITNQKTTINTR